MPLLNRGAIANFFGLADEEEYEYEDYPEQQQVAKQPTKSNTQYQQHSPAVSQPIEKKQRPTTTSRPVGRENALTNETKKVIELHQTSTKNTQKDQRQTRPSVQPNTQLAGKITVMEPRAYSEAMTIAKRIIAGEATLVNFRLVEEKQARRIVDFLTGTVYALDGDIKRVGDEIFLCTPAGLEIDSSTAQSFADGSMFDL